ncbi:Aquaporin-9 [Trichinella spiralis]|uniref:Aquaporin-9 n=1 Tax=Trichinella spiralis TaxID=6334 RepID=A0ABR3KR06_TRISP
MSWVLLALFCLLGINSIMHHQPDELACSSLLIVRSLVAAVRKSEQSIFTEQHFSVQRRSVDRLVCLFASVHSLLCLSALIYSHTMAKRLRTDRTWIRIVLAEFFGTLVLVMLGDGAIAQAVLSRQQAGNFVTVNVAYALALTFAIYVSGGVSGGHVNPAVTLALCSIGAFIGSSIVLVIYTDAINTFDMGHRLVTGPNATAGIFATYPSDHISTAGSFFDQVLGTAILLMVIVAVTDERNMEVPKAIAPVLIGLAIFSVASGFGYNCGGAINPARDFSPRLLTSLTGWGSETFSVRNYWFWVPIIGPHIGGLIGAALYKLFVGIHWPPVHEITMISSQISRNEHIGLS